MIQPSDIRRKADRLYPLFLDAWLAGEPFFPRVVPCEKRVDENLAAAAESVRLLKSQAKEAVGFGYSVEWQERNSRTYGRNLFPRRIAFDTQDDFLRYVGKQREFAAFAAAVARLRERHPAFEPWIRSHRRQLLENASQLDGLLEVIDYFLAFPRPGVFSRELPLGVDTKFVERNWRILRDWLDLTLPSGAIRADEEHFERRYGLRYAEPLVLLRFLDDAVRCSCGSPWPVISVPLESLGAQAIDAERALIVENKVNLLTLPTIAGAIALGGLGNGVTDLRYVPWLAGVETWYWGDIDVEGFAILSRLRAIFPHVRSLMMDDVTAADWRGRIGSLGNVCSAEPRPNLLAFEQAAYTICAADRLRIEQERLPQTYVLERLKAVGLAHDSPLGR
ncbi:MAG TPA: DUF3322 domain-containing protein [Pirellulales bacterium]|nr:DUF3322 domain-containing protein [Pirellulales bacterium]